MFYFRGIIIKQKIKILDPQQAIKIAAGEVVERPANIIKELLENSIDAGATTITINIQKAGKESIKITDNGYGMSPDDAKLCFAQHATSKITNVDDLELISTYGFRGEALSAISSVSTVELITKEATATAATQIVIKDSILKKESTTAHPTGTSITITDLFASIPARKKFLKSNDTEWNAIVVLFQAFCLTYANVHFKLYHNDMLSFNCPATNDIKNRAAQLWSNNLHSHLITISKTTEQQISLSGAISNAQYQRYNRGQIFTFVNNRWIKNIELSRAILKGYQNLLYPQKYPAVFLFIDINPQEIDVNIHPKKEEVKFLHSRTIEQFIQRTVKKTLNNEITNTLKSEPEQSILEPQPNQTFFDKKPFQSLSFTESTNDLLKTTDKAQSTPAPSRITANNKPYSFDDLPFPEQIEKKTIAIPELNVFQNENPTNMEEIINPEEEINNPLLNDLPTSVSSQTQLINNSVKKETNEKIYESAPFSIIGQYKKTYILIEKNSQLIFVDQHAAHERILYESFKKNFTKIATVQLLFPQIIKLNHHEVALITKQKELFAQHGIIFEQFSEKEIIIQSTPVHLKNKSVEELIIETIDIIQSEQHLDEQEFFKKLNESIHAQSSCKAACKAGDTLDYQQQLDIITKLQIIENRMSCPHGRPTMWNIPLQEIEKQFKRDYKSQKINSFNLL